MTKEEIGRQVNYLRNKKNIELEKLCLGVCSSISLARLEGGERLPDCFVLERIMERVRKSANKIELATDEEAYEIYYLREMIEMELEAEKYEEAAEGACYYESLKIAGQALHKQYIYQVKAILAQEYHADVWESCRYAEEAVLCTLPAFRIECLEDYILGEEEMNMVLMWVEQKIRLGEFATALYGTKILDYIRKMFDDDEVLANLYGKAAWIFMKELIKEEKVIEAAGIEIRAVDVLTANGLLLNLPQLLELLLSCYEKVDRRAYEELKAERDSLKWVYETYGKTYGTERVKLWKSYRRREIYLISEVIKQERRLLNKSQEKIANELDMDQKTISRIETGRYKPKRGTFQKLKEYLGIDRELCSTCLAVEDFELLEWEREVARKIFYRKYGEAEQLYCQLKARLDLWKNENRQYCLYMDAMFAEINGKITKEELLNQCEKAFAVTRRNCGMKDLSMIVLNRNETVIMNYIAKIYGQMGRKEKEIYILEQMLQGFENSKVDLGYHYASVSLIYQHLAGKYEENNQFDEAKSIYKRGILFCLRCERGDMLGKLIMENIYTEERENGEKEACKNYYRQAYQLLKLMRMESVQKNLEKYYLEAYRENIT
ncbi:MAG: helix-turn-helix domain-containing protein [Lachnospiraceae bacterium]|nr:helix-turn-helix domain-containing protein [Lachnospiraceae bacterium]